MVNLLHQLRGASNVGILMGELLTRSATWALKGLVLLRQTFRKRAPRGFGTTSWRSCSHLPSARVRREHAGPIAGPCSGRSRCVRHRRRNPSDLRPARRPPGIRTDRDRPDHRRDRPRTRGALEGSGCSSGDADGVDSHPGLGPRAALSTDGGATAQKWWRSNGRLGACGRTSATSSSSTPRGPCASAGRSPTTTTCWSHEACVNVLLQALAQPVRCRTAGDHPRQIRWLRRARRHQRHARAPWPILEFLDGVDESGRRRQGAALRQSCSSASTTPAPQARNRSSLSAVRTDSPS